MKTLKSICSASLLTLVFFPAFGQQVNLDAVKTELINISATETQAFVSGDCDKVVSLMDDNITFYANGRKPMSKEMIKKFCNGVPRPFGGPLSLETEFYPLTENSGYTVRNMELKNDRMGHVSEVVTKVWKKGKDGWKMTHFHSSAKEIEE